MTYKLNLSGVCLPDFSAHPAHRVVLVQKFKQGYRRLTQFLLGFIFTYIYLYFYFLFKSLSG